jgi:hypothetical protein
MGIGGSISLSTSSSIPMSKYRSISMWWCRSWFTSSSGSSDKLFGGMEHTKMAIMTVWRLSDYEIVVQPN